MRDGTARWDFFGTDYGRAGLWSYVILWIRVAFGAHSLLSGVNYFHPLIGLPALTVSPAGAFIAEMDDVGLYALIKLVEIAVGIMLLANRFVPLALVVELPTTVSIFYLNTFVDSAPRQLFTGPRELLMNGVLILAYWPYFRSLLSPNAVYTPIWRKGPALDRAEPTGDAEGRILP